MIARDQDAGGRGNPARQWRACGTIDDNPNNRVRAHADRIRRSGIFKIAIDTEHLPERTFMSGKPGGSHLVMAEVVINTRGLGTLPKPICGLAARWGLGNFAESKAGREARGANQVPSRYLR